MSMATLLTDVTPEVALDAWRSTLDVRPLGSGRVGLGAALGRVAAEDVLALHPSPPHRCSAMDGIAVRSADVAGAPVVLPAGAFAPIDTGGAVADGWDAVVPLEELTFLERGAVEVRHPAAPGARVRPPGEDIPAGEVVVAAGTRVGAYDLALAAASGHDGLVVRDVPRVVIVPTGDEVRPPGATGTPAPGEVVDSNSIMLAARVAEEGGDPVVTPIVPDDAARIEAVVREVTGDADVVLVLAGSSRGRRDHAADVLARCGTLVVRGVALRPAHPVLLAVGEDGTPLVGVPGYPVSTALTFDRFVLPVLRALLGAAPVAPVRIRVRLTREIHSRRDAEVVVPLVLEPAGEGEPPRAIPQSRRGGALRGLARAGAVLRVPAGADVLAAGTIVEADAR